MKTIKKYINDTKKCEKVSKRYMIMVGCMFLNKCPTMIIVNAFLMH